MFICTLYRETKVLLAPKAEMVQMALLEILEMMDPLDIQDHKDHLVKKAMLQLSKIVLIVHHLLLPKAIKAILVNQENPADLVGQVDKVLLANPVDAFVVFLENQEKMVNQVMMEPMVNLVNRVSLEDLDMPSAFEKLPVQISSSG